MRRALFLALAALIALPLAGCPLGDPGEAVCLETVGDAVPVLEAGDDRLAVRVRNCGTEALTLRGISTAPKLTLDPDALPPLPSRLAPGSAWPFNVVAPLTRSKTSGWFQVHVDEAPEAPFTVFVQIDAAEG